MTILTVTVDTKTNASFLTKVLQQFRFVKNIKQEESGYELSKEQIQILEERMEKYEKGEMKFSKWEDVRKRLSSKK